MHFQSLVLEVDESSWIYTEFIRDVLVEFLAVKGPAILIKYYQDKLQLSPSATLDRLKKQKGSAFPYA